jgi:hypothetical protein
VPAHPGERRLDQLRPAGTGLDALEVAMGERDHTAVAGSHVVEQPQPRLRLGTGRSLAGEARDLDADDRLVHRDRAEVLAEGRLDVADAVAAVGIVVIPRTPLGSSLTGRGLSEPEMRSSGRQRTISPSCQRLVACSMM